MPAQAMELSHDSIARRRSSSRGLDVNTLSYMSGSKHDAVVANVTAAEAATNSPKPKCLLLRIGISLLEREGIENGQVTKGGPSPGLTIETKGKSSQGQK